MSDNPDALAHRLSILMETLDRRDEDRTMRQRRALLGAIRDNDGATLGDIAEELGRGAPAVSRAVDAAVRDGEIDRRQDPDNRRRLQLSLTDTGHRVYEQGAPDSRELAGRLDRLAQSERRAIARAIEILERLG